MSDAEDGDAGPAPIVSVIANPLADSKLTKKVLKVVKKGALHGRRCASARRSQWPAAASARSCVAHSR
jgi:hypothetical protein